MNFLDVRLRDLLDMPVWVVLAIWAGLIVLDVLIQCAQAYFEGFRLRWVSARWISRDE
jgi:hypothetical protein